MPELPVLKTRELLAVLSKTGFKIASQKGSHIKLKKTTSDHVFVVIVPNHDQIRRGTLLSIIRQAGTTKEEFIEKWMRN